MTIAVTVLSFFYHHFVSKQAGGFKSLHKKKMSKRTSFLVRLKGTQPLSRLICLPTKVFTLVPGFAPKS